jgi:hypothetical protein
VFVSKLVLKNIYQFAFLMKTAKFNAHNITLLSKSLFANAFEIFDANFGKK